MLDGGPVGREHVGVGRRQERARRALLFAASLALCGALAGCGGNNEASANQSTLARALTPGVSNIRQCPDFAATRPPLAEVGGGSLPGVDPARDIQVCAYRPALQERAQVVWSAIAVVLSQQERDDFARLVRTAATAGPPPACVPEAQAMYDVAFTTVTGSSARIWVNLSCGVVVGEGGAYRLITPPVASFMNDL